MRRPYLLPECFGQAGRAGGTRNEDSSMDMDPPHPVPCGAPSIPLSGEIWRHTGTGMRAHPPASVAVHREIGESIGALLLLASRSAMHGFPSRSGDPRPHSYDLELLGLLGWQIDGESTEIHWQINGKSSANRRQVVGKLFAARRQGEIGTVC